jgi:hypothetical protein
MEGVPETARGFRRQATASKGSAAGKRAAAAFTPIEGVPEKDALFARTPAGNRAWQAQLAQQLEADLQAAGEATPLAAGRSADAAAGAGGSQGQDEAGVSATDMADALQNVGSLVAGEAQERQCKIAWLFAGCCANWMQQQVCGLPGTGVVPPQVALLAARRGAELLSTVDCGKK